MLRNAEADAGAAAGDERNFIFELAGHCNSLLGIA
jgi:hypothetical protein